MSFESLTVEKGTAVESSQVATLYRLYGPAVYRRCLRLLRNKAEAEDATQQVFIKLLRSPRQFEQHDEVLPWIYSVTTNYCFNLRRNQNRQAQHRAQLAPDESSMTFSERSEARQLAEQVLARTDAVSAAVATQVLAGEREQAEVARELGVSEKTVQRKLKRFVEVAQRILNRSVQS